MADMKAGEQYRYVRSLVMRTLHEGGDLDALSELVRLSNASREKNLHAPDCKLLRKKGPCSCGIVEAQSHTSIVRHARRAAQ